jgi:hypothetical protein
LVELTIELLDQRLESRTLDLEAKLVDSPLQERLTLLGPLVSVRFAEFL